MTIDNEKILSRYQALTDEFTDSPADVYTGEDAAAMAQEQGIPFRKWLQDRIAMQIGGDIVTEELEKGIPQTPEEQEQRIQDVMKRQFDSLLRSLSSHGSHKGMLLMMLMATGLLLEEDLARYSQKEESELKDMMVKSLYNNDLKELWSSLQKEFALQEAQESLEAADVSNSGGLATASYLAVPEVRNCPEAVGAGSTVVCSAYSAGEVLGDVAFGMLIAAGICVVGVVMYQTILPTILGAAGELVKGSVAAVPAAIAAEKALWSGLVVNLWKLAMGTTLISALLGCMAVIAESLDCEPAFGFNVAVCSAQEATHYTTQEATYQ